MFVDIDNPKAPLNVEVMLFPYKKGKKKITPEVCLNVLKSTNYKRSINDMLNCIMMLPKDELWDFRNVVLSTFDNREQPKDVIAIGKKIAESGGFKKQLSSVLNTWSDGDWLASKPVAEKWQASTNNTLVDEKGHVCFVYHYGVNLADKDLVNITKLRFLEGSDIELWGAKNLPADLDVSMCAAVRLRCCDLANLKELKFAEGAEVDIAHTTNLPHNLDLSMCSKVDLTGTDFTNVKELKFRQGSKVTCWEKVYQPVHLDVSMCSTVDFNGCKSSLFRRITFKNREQMKSSSIKLSNDWGGKIDFVEKDNDTSGFSQFLDNLLSSGR